MAERMFCATIDSARASFSSCDVSTNETTLRPSTTSAEQRARDEEVERVARVAAAQADFLERLAVRAEQRQRRARRMQQLDDAVEDELEQRRPWSGRR